MNQELRARSKSERWILKRTKDDSLLVTNLSQPLQPTLRGGNITTFTQYRLDHETSDFVCRDLLLEEQCQMREGQFSQVRGGCVRRKH
jgi:hypothetical protein